jgi:hypothetical protein
VQHRCSGWSNSRTFCVTSVHLLQINSISWWWFRVQQQTRPLKTSTLAPTAWFVLPLSVPSMDHKAVISVSFWTQCNYFQKTVNGGITFTLGGTGTSLPQLGWCYIYISVFKSRLQLAWYFGSSLYRIGSTNVCGDLYPMRYNAV